MKLHVQFNFMPAVAALCSGLQCAVPRPVGLPAGASGEGLRRSRAMAGPVSLAGLGGSEEPRPPRAFIGRTLSPALFKHTIAEVFGAAFPAL